MPTASQRAHEGTEGKPFAEARRHTREGAVQELGCPSTASVRARRRHGRLLDRLAHGETKTKGRWEGKTKCTKCRTRVDNPGNGRKANDELCEDRKVRIRIQSLSELFLTNLNLENLNFSSVMFS